MNRAQIIEADWTYTPNGFESGVQVEVDDAGRIALASAAWRSA